MSTFRGRAPSGLISRETGNYAYLKENGENLLDFGKNYRILDVHCWVGYCGANCCTELIKVDEEEGDENG